MSDYELADEIRALREQAADLQASIRTPSKAHLIGSGVDPRQTTTSNDGAWITAVVNASGRDAEKQAEGKAVLADLQSGYQEPTSKATLGATSQGGGYIVPANRRAKVVELATAANPLRRLFNVVRVSSTAGIDIPLGPVGPTRASVVARGATKPNRDLELGSYTATLYTLAVIYDAANQLLRHSAGAAEQLVLNNGTRSIAQGEAYYIISGAGSTEPKGLNTSIAAGSATFTSSFTASDSTVAGSVRTAVATMLEALARRNVEANGILMNSGDLAHAMVQGSDTAGFWVDESSGQTRILGLPVVTTTLVPTKTAIVGDFASTDLYVGEDFRVDVSDEAGDRWDKNLTGFRFEEEIGFNADPAVHAGNFQRVTTLIP